MNIEEESMTEPIIKAGFMGNFHVGEANKTAISKANALGRNGKA